MSKKLKPCGRCGICDHNRFRAWRLRIERLGHKRGSTRLAIISEIHADVARRYPLGIAVRLNDIIKALSFNDAIEDDIAANDLADLELDEAESVRLNPKELAETAKRCSAAKEWKS